MSTLPPVDPALCCAARVCCGGAKARKASKTLLEKMGIDPKSAEKAAQWMESNDVVFMPRTLSLSIRDLIASSHEYQQSNANSGGDNGKAFDMDEGIMDDNVPKEV